jgi:hypothetical protein
MKALSSSLSTEKKKKETLTIIWKELVSLFLEFLQLRGPFRSRGPLMEKPVVADASGVCVHVYIVCTHWCV